MPYQFSQLRDDQTYLKTMGKDLNVTCKMLAKEKFCALRVRRKYHAERKWPVTHTKILIPFLER